MKPKLGSVSCTISLDMDLLLWIEDYAKIHRINRSSAVRYLVKMGKVYLTMLDERETMAKIDEKARAEEA